MINQKEDSMDIFEHSRLWAVNNELCEIAGLNRVTIPNSHIEIYKGEKLMKVVYNEPSLNFYLKSVAATQIRRLDR